MQTDFKELLNLHGVYDYAGARHCKCTWEMFLQTAKVLRFQGTGNAWLQKEKDCMEHLSNF